MGRLKQTRVAILAHGHPSVSAGGAEIAAKALHEVLRTLPSVTSLLIACVPHGHRLASERRQAHGDTHFIETAMTDMFRLFRRDPTELEVLVDVLRDFRPDVIHLHHILGFGAETLFALRAAFPRAAIVLTFHEYIPICHNQGQMVRTDGTLCERATPQGCNGCFPEIAPQRFLKREHALRAMLALADGFIAPSAFLAERYEQWGLPASQISVIENVVAVTPSGRLLAEPEEAGHRGRFGFFGQITPFKGVDLLLEAVTQISDADWDGSSLIIHGSGLERQPAEFQARIRDLLARAGSRVEMAGAYRNVDLPAMMAEIDWVVVPSIWWENSPVVIQEAFRNGRPVIASNIGGMAEKVRDGIDGMTFAARDAADLARTLSLAPRPGLWGRLHYGITPAASPTHTAETHLFLYRSLLDKARVAA